MARALALILGTVLLRGCADPINSYSKPVNRTRFLGTRNWLG